MFDSSDAIGFGHGVRFSVYILQLVTITDPPHPVHSLPDTKAALRPVQDIWAQYRLVDFDFYGLDDSYFALYYDAYRWKKKIILFYPLPKLNNRQSAVVTHAASAV